MNQRFQSLDVFRGATVALMILVNNPGSWSFLYPPLAHAAWHGCTPTDLVFPFFLFAAGNALAIVLPGLRQGSAAQFWGKVGQRTLLIFLIGLLLNWSPFVRWGADGELVLRSWESLRIMGVLQRIALGWGAAAVIVWIAGRRGAIWGTALLLLGYWAACHLFGEAADPYSLPGFFGTSLDRAVLGVAHLYKGEGVPFDPEGVASTPPAIAQVLLGYLVGELIVRSRLDAALVARLFVAACVALLLAYAWQLEMPLNKKIWSSSYVLLTTGLAMISLALLVYLLDVQGKRDGCLMAWVPFCEVFGKNALFVFVMSGFVPRVLGLLRWSDGVDGEGKPRWMSPLPWLYRTVFASIGTDPRIGSLLFAVANLAAYWLLARWLDRRRTHI